MASERSARAPGPPADVPIAGGLVAGRTAVGGAGIVRRTIGGAGSGEDVGVVLGGWGASGLGNRNDRGGESDGDGGGGAVVSTDEAPVDDVRVAAVGVRARNGAAGGGLRNLGGVGGGAMVETGAGEAPGMGETEVGGGACVDVEKVISC